MSPLDSKSNLADAGDEDTTGHDLKALTDEAESSNISLEDITDGTNGRGIPAAKFVDDIGAFAESFSPPASAELLIGAFSDLFTKFKQYEQSLSARSELLPML